jgi:serine/threonine-protein kinase HipA
MLHDDTGWRLSPAFDMVPNIGFNQEHVLRVGLDNRPPDLGTLLGEAKYFGIKRQQNAIDVIREVHIAVSGWRTVFEECNVPETDTFSIGKDIRLRLKKITMDSQ